MRKHKKPIHLNKVFLLILLYLALFTLASCGSDDPVVEPPASQFLYPPPDPEALISNFENIMTEMLIDELGVILHDDFQLVLPLWMIDDWDLPAGTTVDREQMLHIHSNMFGGTTGTDDRGELVHPINSIEFELFERQGPWIDTPSEDSLFPGTKRALYQTRIFFSGSHLYGVNQALYFYATTEGEYSFLSGIKTRQNKGFQEVPFEVMIYLFNTIHEPLMTKQREYK